MQRARKAVAKPKKPEGVIIATFMATERAQPSSLLFTLLVMVGCASTPPMSASPPPLPTDEPPPRTLPSTLVARPSTGDASSVQGAEGLVALCQSLREEPLEVSGGDPVQQARVVEAQAERRQAALAGRYVVVIPAAGFAFMSYELGERRLLLDTDRGLMVGDGAELVVPSKESAPGFVLPPELAERLIALRSQGTLALRLIFKPAGSQVRKDACIWLGGGRVVKMEIEILGSALVTPDGTVLSRGDTGEYADASPQFPVRAAKVSVRKARFEDGRELPTGLASAFDGLAEKAQPCYERRLTARPALRGTLVIGLRIGAAGHVEAPRVEMSSLGDEALVTCAMAAVGKATVAGATSGQRFSVPLQFGSKEEH